MPEPTLREQIAVEPARPRVVAECVTLIDNQVKSKGGLKGVALKGAYGAIKTVKRGFVREVVEALLDDWLDKLEPYYVKWNGGSGGFSEYLIARSGDVAEDLLQVTDERAETTKHKTAKKYYFKMRGKAKDNVIEAVPELARLIERHLQGNEGDAVASA